MTPSRRDDLAWLPYATYLGGLVPFGIIVYRALTGDLGANPISDALDAWGEYAVKLLLLSLACTPARIVTGATWPLRVRKALGLLAFTYASIHLVTYVAIDQSLDLRGVMRDVWKRPFIALGMSAYVLLVPLAATSTKRALQWLGARRWRLLHRLVYAVAVLAIVHYVMRQKKDATVALVHGGVLAVLLAVRIFDAFQRRAKQLAGSARSRARAVQRRTSM